jgi:hypothetical protein
MKVLDHVPPTMHNFVTEAFKTLPMGLDDFWGGYEPSSVIPHLWRRRFGGDGWNSQGEYSFGGTFEGSAIKPYWTHEIQAYLNISCLDDDVHIEWKMSYMDLASGQGVDRYWPGVRRELERFSFDVYHNSLERVSSREYLQEFIEELTL